MKVLVTGGAGFIGSTIADRLVRDGHDVVVLDDLSSGKREQVPAAANFYHMDIENHWVDRVVEREKPEAVCHLAAQLSVRRSVDDPLFDARVNVLGSVRLLEAVRRHGVGRVIFASTGGAIYGDADEIPTPETYTAEPVSPYGAAKLSVEHYLRVFTELAGVTTVALRLANVYGPRQDPHGEAGVVAIFSRALLEGLAPTINGDGAQTRDYVYVDDVADAFILALRSGVTGSYNIGTGRETNVKELYRLIASGARSDIAAVHGEAKIGEQRRSCLDAARATTDLGWTPRVTLEEGIPRTVEYFRSQVAEATSRT